MRLSDAIESFIKTMLTQDEPEVELRRNELAEYFNCAPSQINYVLATRFTPDDGYVIESRRGGGGYIRIVRVAQSADDRFRYLLNERIGDAITELEAGRLAEQLRGQKLLTDGETVLMKAAVSAAALSVPMPETLKDAQRARIMKTMLLAIVREKSRAANENKEG